MLSGNFDNTTEPSPCVALVLQEYTYNSMGQNTSVRDGNNGISTAQYDTLGNITSLSGPLGGTILKSDILEKFSIMVLTNGKNSDILVYK